jgi:hypothetical protein
MISTVILVHAEFDIARGCKTLRAHIAAQNWKPTVGARATAAFTAMGDMILNSTTDELVPISMTITNTCENASIELGCSLYLPDINSPEMVDATQRLRRATDELDVYETAGNVQVIARLCVKCKEAN